MVLNFGYLWNYYQESKDSKGASACISSLFYISSSEKKRDIVKKIFFVVNSQTLKTLPHSQYL